MTISIIALTIAVAVVVALVLVWLGYQFAVGRLRDAHTDIARQQAALDAEWWQLQNTQRIHSVFHTARRAMQREAENSLWPPVADAYTPSTEEQDKTR